MESRRTPQTEYGYVCDSCKRGRKYGAARLTAERVASRHHVRFPDHIVHLTVTNIVFTYHRGNTAYHELGDEAPF